MSEARERWLNEGVEVLAEEGATGLRIDRIAARLGLSKGSFHHHFRGAAGFRRDLLDHLERMQTRSFADAVANASSHGNPSPHEVLRRLIPSTADTDSFYRPELETALRAWALTNPDAAATQTAIDRARLAELQGIWRQITTDEDTVRTAALLPYVIALGASVAMPPIGVDDLQRLYEWIMPFVPGGSTRPGSS